MKFLETWLTTAAGYLWGWPGADGEWPWWPQGLSLLVLLVMGGGLYFTLRFGLIQLRGFVHSLRVIAGQYDRPGEPGAISHLQALSAALSGTVGLGNIAGVAIAVKTGGPGAVFWMWMLGFVGMATKFCECSLATHYRHAMPNGELRGGPMYYIVDGLGQRWRWLAVLFCFFCIMTSFGGGNMFQSNQVAQIFADSFHVPTWITGVVLAIALGLVIIGGIQRIGRVAGVLVPVMCLIYVVGAVLICVTHPVAWWRMMGLIIQDAFALKPLLGGSLGAIIIIGVQRAVFSSESGFGSAPIAHAAARTDEGVRQGIVALLEPFIDTLVVCTATASVILLSGVYQTSEATAVTLTVEAFDVFLPGFGRYFVAIAVGLFAYSTAIAWSYYGQVAAQYVFGPKADKPYRVIFVLMYLLGAIWVGEHANYGPVMNFTDVCVALMVIPNVMVCLWLSGTVARLQKDYFRRLRSGAMSRRKAS